MRSRRIFVGALIAGVGVGLLMTGQAGAQSVAFGNALIDVLDAEGDTVFHVDTNSVDIGGTGADTDLYIRTSTGSQALRFYTNGADMYIGATGNPGDLLIYDAANSWTFYHNGSSGDLTLGGGAHDGDLLVKSSTGSYSIVGDGDFGDLRLGGGTADGDLYLRDLDGVTNNIILDGNGASLTLGTSTGDDDGDIVMFDGTGTSTVGLLLWGDQGTIHNKITGNGLVKGWAQVNGDGTVSSCWRCSTSATDTSKQDTGVYEVDFTIDADITGRPVLCSTGHNDSTINGQDSIACVQRSGDTSTVWVVTRNGAGATADSNFTVLVF